MVIETIDTLTNQLNVLKSAPELHDLYRNKVVEPLRPVWEPALVRMPAGLEQPNPVQMIGMFDPSTESVKKGLEALARLEHAGSWAACQEALIQAERLLKPEEHGVRLNQIGLTLILGSERRFGKEPGFTGSSSGGIVTVVVWPSDYNVPRLPSIAAHEFHHIVRMTYEPWTTETTVGQYLVIEGLAEAFAAEMCGEDMLGPWVHMLTDAQHEELKPRYSGVLQVSGFNEIRGYIFGDLEENYGFERKGLPPYAGYSIGYRVVTEYLRRTGKSATEATYVPWREIIEESRYF
ncbi:MAG: Protein of unknown function Zn-dependent protease-related protein [Paenibacillus sp.]|nr:Protein of unknown function Zn-dependent protease-related protein [Paenibacillus sp.]